MNKVKDLSFIEMLRQVLTGERECLHTSEDPVDAGEVVLGVLENPIARALFSFRVELANSTRKFGASLPEEPPVDRKGKIELACKAQMFQSRFESVDKLFWEVVSSEFPETRNPTVSTGIREGWQVVIFKKTQRQFSLFDLFGG